MWACGVRRRGRMRFITDDGRPKPPSFPGWPIAVVSLVAAGDTYSQVRGNIRGVVLALRQRGPVFGCPSHQ
ncbi:hypothetical protein HPP92_023223 [Vanilla planifolia]|uniref:Uncharacterized protein n=1 Tax=Vanilla planifolia TaxID=51239 RepID=A0A835UG23_VANPL|nr:hypothetical protein HPP92_023223 [Vanilla planifolia]